MGTQAAAISQGVQPRGAPMRRGCKAAHHKPLRVQTALPPAPFWRRRRCRGAAHRPVLKKNVRPSPGGIPGVLHPP